MSHTANCSICLDEASASTNEELRTLGFIAPCKCSGSQKWIHRSCLDEMRTFNHDGEGFSKCTVCKTAFTYEEGVDNQPWRRRGKYCALITRDILLAVLATHVVLVILAVLVYWYDSSDDYQMLRALTDSDSTSMVMGSYYCLSWVVTLASAGLLTTFFLATKYVGGGYGWHYHGRSNSRDSGSGAFLMVLIVIMVIIGLVVGSMMASYYFVIRSKAHFTRVYYKGEAAQYVVRDLSFELD